MMAVLSAAAITSCGTQTVKDSDLVMEIEGQPVVKAEYQMILENYVAQVKGQYTTDQANQKAGGWHTTRTDYGTCTAGVGS